MCRVLSGGMVHHWLSVGQAIILIIVEDVDHRAVEGLTCLGDDRAEEGSANGVGDGTPPWRTSHQRRRRAGLAMAAG